MVQSTYTDSPGYIDHLEFDYVETYSFQRGKEYEENLEGLKTEYFKLKTQKDKGVKLSTEEENRLEQLSGVVGFTQYLLNDRNEFHPSSKRTHTILSGDARLDLIKEMLKTEVVDVPMWLCGPVYRDAIVFYNKEGKIVSVLNICLGCQYMEIEKFHYINGDDKLYDRFKQFFIDLGHEVEKE